MAAGGQPGRALAAQAGPLAAPARKPRWSRLERWPKWLICVPLTVQWLWLSLRHGSASLPSSANPRITAGGLVGEGKLEYLRAMGPIARAATAPWCALAPASHGDEAAVLAALQASGLPFPAVVKPDLGMCGFGVRRVDDLQALMAYLREFPPGQTALLQAYLAATGEAGIFYARHPGDAAGRVIGLALRLFPQLQGDGVASVAQLLARDPRAAKVRGRRDHLCPAELHRVPAPGEVVRLATIGSTRVGGLYLDGAAHIGAPLSRAIDAIARDMPDFHFGRFDVRFDELADLRAGRFTVMEVNGAGSEAIEAWDPATPLPRALAIIFAKQALLFEIGAANRALGHRPMGLRAMARHHLRQQALLDRYPPSN